ncbi:unnamed protein product [Musa hybrid cultivar]
MVAEFFNVTWSSLSFESFGSVSLSRPPRLPPLLLPTIDSTPDQLNAIRSSHTLSELSIYHCRFQKYESMFLRTLVRADMEVCRVIPS